MFNTKALIAIIALFFVVLAFCSIVDGGSANNLIEVAGTIS